MLMQNQRVLFSFVILTSLTSLFGCGVSDSKSSSPASTVEKLSSPICQSPIDFDEPGKTRLTDNSSLNADYKLVEMQMHILFENNNHSFASSAKAADNFSVKVDCNGSPAMSGVDSSISGTLTTADTLNFLSKEEIDQREMKVKIENETVVTSETKSKHYSGDKDIYKFSDGKKDLPNGGVFESRYYKISETRFEVLLKFEFGKSGEHFIETGRAIYEKK